MSAVRFLTILPVPNGRGVDPMDMIGFFPLVGCLLGAMLACADHLLLHLWPPYVVALADVVLLAAVTGAFHYDGLADTADGLYGQRDTETALKIMKDSRIGTMGAMALICTVSLKWAGLLEIGADRFWILLVVPAYSRSGVLFAVRRLAYGRSESGLGYRFFARPLRYGSFAGLLLPLGLSLLIGWRALLLAAGFVILVFGIIRYYHRKMNCVTGDMLGALIETAETGLFLLASIGWQ